MTIASLNSLLKLHEELISRERVRTNLLDWASEFLTGHGLRPAAHHRLLLEQLDLLARGDNMRLMVCMPPGSAKSTYVSVLFPVWWFTQQPRSSIIAASHTSGLVESFSRRIRNIISLHERRLGFGLSDGHSTATDWRTTAGGEYLAVGVRGSVTGRRADLIIIDDPIKSMSEASSARHRRTLWEWYTGDLVTRLKPHARVVLVMTRWHPEDLAGRILSVEPERWKLIDLPAIAEAADPIGRPECAPLWPEWEDLSALEEKRQVVGHRVWTALFQQRPERSSGSVFKPTLLVKQDRICPRELVNAPTVRAWDLAATAADDGRDPDWTVGIKLAKLHGGRFLIDDVVRMRASYAKVVELIAATALADGTSVLIGLPIDPGQAGKAQTAHLTSVLAGYAVRASRETGSKVTRALPIAAQIEAGNVLIRTADWSKPLIDELELFPNGAKDDQVDALSRAYATLTQPSATSGPVFLPYNQR